MASPPFDVSITTPADNDIVSQFPANERLNRDIIESWLLANHDTNGDHKWLKMPWQPSPPATPGSSIINVFADAFGKLRILYPDGSIGYVGFPPGSIIWTADDVVPVGFLLPDGSAVSRSTYADLFGYIGTTYGVGNGSTTFNLPDARGRVFVGEDAAQVNMSSTAYGTAPILGAVRGGGNNMMTLAVGHLPPYTPSGTVPLSGPANNLMVTNAATIQGGPGPGSTFVGTGAVSLGATFNGNPQGGVSTPFSIVQGGIVFKPIIKT